MVDIRLFRSLCCMLHAAKLVKYFAVRNARLCWQFLCNDSMMRVLLLAGFVVREQIFTRVASVSKCSGFGTIACFFVEVSSRKWIMCEFVS